jgi:predicted metalloprotease with PDZ domain
VTEERKNAKPSLDAGIGRDAGGARLTQVHEGGAAHQAGLSAGDILIAVDGLRVNGNPCNLEQLFSRYRVGDTVTVHAFRRYELMAFDVVLQGERVPNVTLAPVSGTRRTTTLVRPSAS